MDSVDLMKFVLSLMVIALHMQPVKGGYEVVRMVCRIAVPLFFMASAFLFFRKVVGKDCREALKAFTRRTLILYLVWMVVLLPFTIQHRKWNTLAPGKAIFSFVLNFFFGSTFIASWFLMSLIIGVNITALAGRRLNNRTLFGISAVIYVLCCLCSAYGKLLHIPVIDGVPKPYNSFPVSLIWITLGKIIAEEGKQLGRVKKRVNLKAAAFLFGLLYMLEYLVCIKCDFANVTDALFFLVPLCTVLFLIVLDTDINLGPTAVFMRKVSIVTYCMHAAFGWRFTNTMRRIAHMNFSTTPQCLFRYVVILCVCVFTTYVIDMLSRKWRFFSYFY